MSKNTKIVLLLILTGGIVFYTYTFMSYHYLYKTDTQKSSEVLISETEFHARMERNHTRRDKDQSKTFAYNQHQTIMERIRSELNSKQVEVFINAPKYESDDLGYSWYFAQDTSSNSMYLVERYNNFGPTAREVEFDDAIEMYRLDSEFGVIESISIPMNSLTVDNFNGLLLGLRCFSCGCSCYVNTKVMISGGRIFVEVAASLGDILPNRNLGIYEYTNGSLHKLVGGLSEDGRSNFTIENDGCLLTYQIGKKFYEMNLFST